MDKNEGLVSCTLGCWLVAALGGVLAAALLWSTGGWTFLQGAFVGAIVFVLAGLLLSLIMCRSMPAIGETPQPTAREKAEAARAVAEARSAENAKARAAEASGTAATAAAEAPETPTIEAEPAPTMPYVPGSSGAAGTGSSTSGPAVKPSKPLAGEAELAERKGSWTYEGDSDEAPKKAAAKPAKASAKEEAAATTPDFDGDGVKEGENEGTKPASLDGPRDGGPDNLKEIKGVGPKLEGVLHSMGFYHFDQIANWSADEVAWVNANLIGFKGRVTRDNWIEQAKILAAGGETEFSKRVDKGGVY